MLQVQTAQRVPELLESAQSGFAKDKDTEPPQSPQTQSVNKDAEGSVNKDADGSANAGKTFEQQSLLLSGTEDQKWIDHANMKKTTMDQKTLPADVKHQNKKTMTTDWRQEYPTAPPVSAHSGVVPMRSDASLISVASSLGAALLIS